MECTKVEGPRPAADLMSISDASSALAYKDRPVAIVVGTTDNGDTVISSLQSSAQIRGYVDEDSRAGLLQPEYVAPTDDGA